MIQIPDAPTVPSVSDVKENSRFVQLWKLTGGIQQLIPNSRFNQIHKN